MEIGTKLKKQLISLINNNIGLNIVLDIIEIKESQITKNNYILTCLLIDNKVKDCLIDKGIVDILNKKIARWVDTNNS